MVRIEPHWVTEGGHFGYVAARFTATDGRPAHFVFSGMFGKPADLQEAWHTGFDAPATGPAGRIVAALVGSGKAALVEAIARGDRDSDRLGSWAHPPWSMSAREPRLHPGSGSNSLLGRR